MESKGVKDSDSFLQEGIIDPDHQEEGLLLNNEGTEEYIWHPGYLGVSCYYLD